MDVCGDYLATFEGSMAKDRINILKVNDFIEVFVVHTFISKLLAMFLIKENYIFLHKTY